MAGPWERYQQQSTTQPSGQLEAGNIDLGHRPIVRNADGSISTVRSMSANFDGQEVLIPTVSDDGRVLSEPDAIDLYRRTGRHLGKFSTPDAATAYAEQLHRDQEAQYVPQAQQQAAGPWTRYQAPSADFSDVQGGTSTSTAPAAPERSFGQKVAREGGLGLRNVVEGAGDLVGIVTDPIVDLANWAGEKAPTLNSLASGVPERRWPVQQHTREAWSNALTAAGVPNAENEQERVAGDVGRALTGTALTMGAGAALQGARGAGAAAGSPTVTSRVGDFLTAQPVQQAIAAAGGAGASGIAREAGVGPGGQALAGLAGALTPAGLTTLGAATLRGLVRGGSGAQMARTVGDFNSLGATPSVGQASGNRAIQGVENLLAGGPTSSGVMIRFAEQQAEDIGGGLQRSANAIAPNASAERAGRAVEKGAETFANNTKAMKRALYWQADQFIPGNTQMPLARTQATLQQLTTPVQGALETTGALIKPRIQQLADNLNADIAAAQAAGGAGIPYEAVKKIRSEIGEQLSDFTLSADRPTAELKRLYASLSQDLEEAARAAGPQAERAARRANNYTRAAADRIEQVQRVIDKNGGPENVFNAAMSGTRDGGTTLRAVMQSLPKEGQQALTGAVIKRMGLASPGAQDAAGDVFSAGTFMANWNRISREAKRALFDRYGAGFSANMDRIARVANNIKQGSKIYANPSGTANRAAAMTYGGALVGSLFTGGTSALLGGGVLANATARALTSPSAAKWLARATALPKGAILPAIRQMEQESSKTGDEDLAAVAQALRDADSRQNEPANAQ